ncbi:MAG: transcription elongation factor GreA [Sphingobacteriales bacterium]|nr:transcription elongation factor GreA [Sphingobacteriales bacterium]
MTIKYFTPEGLEKLKKDLHKLRTKDRIEISRQIAEARDKGDLSENAEYDAAKEAQGMLEMKIAALETELANARLIDESKIDSSKVMILSKVHLKNLNINKELEYMLVSEKEADLKLGKIAISTPIAQGILGHTVGDVVEIAVPSGKLRLEILSIGR